MLNWLYVLIVLDKIMNSFSYLLIDLTIEMDWSGWIDWS